jgi:hypothetical protein
MHDSIQDGQPFPVAEGDVGQRDPIQTAVPVEDIRTEGLRQGGQGRLADFRRFPGDLVGVKDHIIQTSQIIAYETLACTDSAGQSKQSEVPEATAPGLVIAILFAGINSIPGVPMIPVI